MTTSSQILTDIGSAITTGPSANSKANAIAAAGPITDILGMLELAKLKCQETKNIMIQIVAVLDAGDGIKSTIQNIRDTFV